MTTSRTPDFVLKALDKRTERKGRIGAAWVNEDGSISIALDPFVTISGAEQLTLNLFPYDKKKDKHTP